MSASPQSILRELADLWVSLGKQEAAGVLRACAMTLLVVAEESDDAAAIGETLAALMPEHPSRAVVIRVGDGGREDVRARVFAQCWMPFGQRRHICCEQVEIMAAEAALADLAALVLPLVVPDLPLVVWCRSPRLFVLPAAAALLGLGHKLITDSAAFGDTRAGLEAMARATPARVLGDLAWTRVTRWREAVARACDAQALAGRLASACDVRIAHSGRQPPPEAIYLAAWLLAGLRQAGAEPGLTFESAALAQPLARLDLECGGTRVSLRRLDAQTAEMRLDGVVLRTSFPEATSYLLLREELSIPGHDPVFERTLAAAAALAVSSKT